MSQKLQDDRFPIMQKFVCSAYAALHEQAKQRRLTDTETLLLHKSAGVLQHFSDREFKVVMGVVQ